MFSPEVVKEKVNSLNETIGTYERAIQMYLMDLKQDPKGDTTENVALYDRRCSELRLLKEFRDWLVKHR